MLSANPLPFHPPDTALEWLRGRTLEDLKAFDVEPPCPACNGTTRDPTPGRDAPCISCEDTPGKASIPRVHFPDVLRYRNARGQECEEPILFVIPDPDELADGRRDAVAFVAQKHGAKLARPEDAAALIGAAYWENLDSFGVLSRCIRSRKPPHARKYLLHVLVKTFGGGTTLHDAWERLGLLRRLWDVRLSSMTEEEFWGFCAEVARVKNTSPLVVLDPGLLNAFIAKAAVELTRCRSLSLSSGSSEVSTAA